MILEVDEFIKIINGLRSEVRNYSDIVQDDMNKINEKIIKEYDKTVKNLLNFQKELNDKIEKLETDKHNLIERNKELEKSENLDILKKMNNYYEVRIKELENNERVEKDKNEAKINSIRENYEMIIKEKTMTNIEDEEILRERLSNEAIMVSDLKKIIEKLENEIKSYKDKCEGLENTNKRTNK